MRKNYILMLSTKEEKGYNKFCHLVTKHTDDKLHWIDIVKEDYPKMTISGTEEQMKTLIELLEEDGFDVKVVMEMNRGKVITMSLEEYDKFLSVTSGDVWGIANENGEWFYILTEDAKDDLDEAVYKMLGEELYATVVDVIVDISKQKVAIICE